MKPTRKHGRTVMKQYFNVMDMLNMQAKQDGFINEEDVYCYIYNIICNNVKLGNFDFQYIIDFENISLDGISVGKFIWYLHQSFNDNILSKILLNNFSLIQYRQLTSSFVTYNQKVYENMQKQSQNVEKLLQEKPEIKEQFNSLMERWNK